MFSDKDITDKKFSTENVQIFNNIPILICEHLNKDIINILNKLGYTNTEYTTDKSIDQIKNYEILFIDLNKSNNCHILKKIKKEEKKPYIIGITDKRKKKYEKYVDAFISTPVDINELKALLKVISRRLN